MARRAPLAGLAIAGVVALLLVGVVAWKLLSSGIAASRERHDAAPAAARDDALANPASVAPASAASSTPDSEPSFATATRSTASRVAAASELVVEVVDAVTQQPVAGARVGWLARSRLDALHGPVAANESMADDLETIDECGASGVTDARGELVVERPTERTVFSAEHDGSWARGDFLALRNGKSDRLRLALSGEGCLRVQVVDRGGRPVPDAVVAFGSCGGNLGEQSRRARTRSPDGIAKIRDLERYQRFFQPVPDSWCVMLCTPALVPPSVPVDPRSPPAEPYVLTLPDAGSMTFQFVGRDGQPLDATLVVHLISFQASGLEHSGSLGSTFAAHRRAMHGRLDLPCVGLGVMFDVRPRLDGVVLTVAEPRGARDPFLRGPVAAGDHVDLRLEVDVGPMRFSGHLVDERGEPMWRRPFALVVAAPGHVTGFDPLPPHGARGETGDDARFEVSIPFVGAPAKNERAFLLVTLADGSTVSAATGELTVSADRKSVDLGDVRLSMH